MKKINIAIDGYAGCGKSTLAHDLADALGYTFIDTGAMFRAITYLTLATGQGKTLQEKAEDVIRREPQLRFHPRSNAMLIDGENREADIRSAEIAAKVSQVASIAAVREYLRNVQVSMIRGKGVVMEGRDIGTVIMPDAEVKLFITASMETRIQRRLDQLKAAGVEATKKEVEANLISRDKADSSRAIAPLSLAEGAVVIDTSDFTRKEQLKTMLSIVNPVIHVRSLLPYLH